MFFTPSIHLSSYPIFLLNKCWCILIKSISTVTNCSLLALLNALHPARVRLINNQHLFQRSFYSTGSIMEAAQNRPSFQTYLPAQDPPSTPTHRHGSFSTPQGHGSLDRRVSEPYSPDVVRRKKDLNAKRHSMLVESNLTKEAKEINRRSHEVTIVKNLSMG